ncbi:GNAT family N-acetyltransferase [Octadecabacter sp. SW4]|uniref:GNAT family N-acetyltransferase n=1 Tax=Octadecabacter sp. SW4 TaxID=2602067 RepID=UPI0020C7AFB6|nr:GNAT family N-acetyltransferase [Octadecabacter sp. SW4]|tara:strand:- start:642 stop:1259 length:618 start_codon:yes stop_codon:yes gene_type:complete
MRRMALENGFHDVPAGKIAMVVTHLEMRARPAPRDIPDVAGLALRRVPSPDLAWYRALFRRVGADDWLWFSRLVMDDAKLTAILQDPDVHVCALTKDGADMGLLELDFREGGACELAYFGIDPALIGQGAGRWMMEQATALAWDAGISRLHVHTCSIDHHAALGFYLRSGFKAVRRQIEVADDPRLIGVLPETAGGHVPVIGDDR